MRRATALLVATVLLIGAVVVQVSGLTRLGLPGPTPPLVAVVAAVLGAARGRTAGAVAGFAGGLLLDLAPPADHPVGSWALVLTPTGYLAGRLAADRVRRASAQVLVVAALAALATAGYLLVTAALGAGWPPWPDPVTLVVAAGAYAALLAVALLPLIGWLVARTAPAAVGW